MSAVINRMILEHDALDYYVSVCRVASEVKYHLDGGSIGRNLLV